MFFRLSDSRVEHAEASSRLRLPLSELACTEWQHIRCSRTLGRVHG